MEYNQSSCSWGSTNSFAEWVTGLCWCYLPDFPLSWEGVTVLEAWHADSTTDKGGALVSRNQANWWGILCHRDTIKVKRVGKSIRFLLWLLCNSITAVPLGPKAATLSQEVLKRDIWIRALVDKGKVLPLCILERGVVLRIIKRAGEMFSWHCFLGCYDLWLS